MKTIQLNESTPSTTEPALRINDVVGNYVFEVYTRHPQDSKPRIIFYPNGKGCTMNADSDITEAFALSICAMAGVPQKNNIKEALKKLIDKL